MLDTFLFQFTSLFTMINPIAAIPIYIALTEAMTPKAARWVAMRAAITAFIALSVFALVGEFLFSFFSISVNGLRVAGGVLFFIMGFEMLRGRTVPVGWIAKPKVILAFTLPLPLSVSPLFLALARFLWLSSLFKLASTPAIPSAY